MRIKIASTFSERPHKNQNQSRYLLQAFSNYTYLVPSGSGAIRSSTSVERLVKKSFRKNKAS